MIGQISATEKGGKVVIEITPDKAGKISSTGKSKIYASTSGFAAVQGTTGFSFNLNLLKKV